MTIKEFMEIQIDGDDVIAIYDYNSNYDYVKNCEAQGGMVYEGWYSEIEAFTDYKLIEKWLNSDIVDWNYYNSLQYGKIICLNILSNN